MSHSRAVSVNDPFASYRANLLKYLNSSSKSFKDFSGFFNALNRAEKKYEVCKEEIDELNILYSSATNIMMSLWKLFREISAILNSNPIQKDVLLPKKSEMINLFPLLRAAKDSFLAFQISDSLRDYEKSINELNSEYSKISTKKIKLDKDCLAVCMRAMTVFPDLKSKLEMLYRDMEEKKAALIVDVHEAQATGRGIADCVRALFPCGTTHDVIDRLSANQQQPIQAQAQPAALQQPSHRKPLPPIPQKAPSNSNSRQFSAPSRANPFAPSAPNNPFGRPGINGYGS